MVLNLVYMCNQLEWKLQYWVVKTLFAVSVNGIIPILTILVDIMVYWFTYNIVETLKTTCWLLLLLFKQRFI